MTATIGTKWPQTLEERLALGADELRFPASFEAFVALLEHCEYPVEFQDEHIIAMSIASDPHEKIVANVLYILGALFHKKKEYNRYGSNRHIWLPEFETAYSPDASVVYGEPQIFEYAKGKSANLNPWLLVEVLSNSTRQRDWGEKLLRYKQTSSLRYIIYAEQDIPLVTVFSRAPGETRWKAEDFDQLDQTFEIEGQAVLLADLYENIEFDAGHRTETFE